LFPSPCPHPCLGKLRQGGEGRDIFYLYFYKDLFVLMLSLIYLLLLINLETIPPALLSPVTLNILLPCFADKGIASLWSLYLQSRGGEGEYFFIKI